MASLFFEKMQVIYHKLKPCKSIYHLIMKYLKFYVKAKKILVKEIKVKMNLPHR